MKKSGYVFTLIGLLLFSEPSLTALEMSIGLKPQINIPLYFLSNSDVSKAVNGTVLGATGTYEFHLFDLLSVGAEGSFNYIPKNGTPSYLTDFSGGMNISVFCYPLSRLMLQGGIGTGIYYANYEFPGILDSSGQNYEPGKSPQNIPYGSFYLKAFFDAAFRINPNLSVGAEIGYSNFFKKSFSFNDVFLAGPDFGMVLKYTFDTNKYSKNIQADVIQDDSIFPVYAKVYKENGFAYADIINNESAEIRNVKVYFRAQNYTDSLFPSGEIPLIRKGKSVSIPLLADFSKEIASFTENGQIPGEIIVEYDLLGKKRTATETCVLDVYNRNAMRWADPAVISMFVSPNANEVLELSKYLVGIARDSLKSGLERNMQFGIWIVEGINLLGIDYVPGVTTPYSTYHLDLEQIDTVQFPFQTLTYKSGDADDLGVLISALLQSVGIETAVIPLTDDFVVCISLSVSEIGASSVVNKSESLLYCNNQTWLPLSMKNIKKGFYGAWTEALNEIANEENGAELIVMQDAWASYPALGISGKATYEKSNPNELKKKAESETAKYIQNEIQPKIKAQIALVNSNPSEKNLNTLGLLYVRSGEYKLAKETYNRSAKSGSISAMTNLANIAILEKDYATAKSWYEKVLEKNPSHSGAKKGLERIASETGN